MALFDEHPVDLRILIFIFDLRPALVFILVGFGKILHKILESPRLERDKSGGFGAWTKVLVVPVKGRHHEARRMPVDPLRFGSFRPHERVAVAAENHDMRSGTMTMRFLVFPWRKGGKMGAHRIAGEFKKAVASAGPARRMFLRLEFHKISDKISFPDPPRLDAFLNILTRLG